MDVVKNGEKICTLNIMCENFYSLVVWNELVLDQTLYFVAFDSSRTGAPYACRAVISRGSLRICGRPPGMMFTLGQYWKHLGSVANLWEIGALNYFTSLKHLAVIP